MYELTASRNEARNQAEEAENQAKEAKIQFKEAVAARQNSETEVIRLQRVIRTFQSRPAMPPILNSKAHTQQQKPSPILLPFIPQMHHPSLKSPFDPQLATTRNTKAQHQQYFPNFNSLGSKFLASSS
jgi:hypothetical protein